MGEPSRRNKAIANNGDLPADGDQGLRFDPAKNCSCRRDWRYLTSAIDIRMRLRSKAARDSLGALVLSQLTEIAIGSLKAAEVDSRTPSSDEKLLFDLKFFNSDG